MLGIEPTVSHMLGKCPTTELHIQHDNLQFEIHRCGKGLSQKEKYSESIEQRIEYRELEASLASGCAKTPGMVKI